MHIVSYIACGDAFDEDNFSTLIFDKQRKVLLCIHGNISDKLNYDVSWRKKKNLRAMFFL